MADSTLRNSIKFLEDVGLEMYIKEVSSFNNLAYKLM